MISTALRMTASWLTCLLLLTTAHAAPRAAEPRPQAPPQAPEPSAALRQQLDAKLPELVLNKTPLEDAIQQVHEVARANVVIDWASLKPVGVTKTSAVTATLRDVPLADALNTILAEASGGKVTCLASRDVVWIMSKEAVPRRTAALDAWSKRKVTDAAIQKYWDKRLPELKLDSIPASDVFDALRDLTGANITVNWKNLQAAGVKRNMPVSLRLRDVTVGDVLLVLLELLPADRPPQATIDDGVITVDIAAS